MVTELTLIVVEDNELLRDEMVSFLNRPGWVAHGVDCGEELSVWLRKHTPDIAILDINLPYEDGYSIGARLRQSHPEMGIIMLTARTRGADRSTGYQAGADVYLTKPTNTVELVAVITNLSRRVQRKASRQLQLDRAQGLLNGPEGDCCRLTASELRLLELLALAPEREADSEYLLSELLSSGSRVASRENLTVLVSRLRVKCQQIKGVNNLIAAHRGLGYRLTLPIMLI